MAAEFSNYLLTCFLALLLAADPGFTFAILGDRTGQTQPGVYQHVCRQIDQLHPAFAINVGDTIQGGEDAAAAREWEELRPMLNHAFPLYLVPGNHDIWSAASERVWRKVTGHAPDYSFDHRGVHIVVLDNSRTNELSPRQWQFLDADLAAHKSAPLKLIFFHQPFWLAPVMFRNTSFALHRLARQYGVAAIVSGHVHSFNYWQLDGIQYVLAGSSGAHLRGDRFADGWFFQWIEARVRGASVEFIVHELPPPHGQGRVIPAAEWSARAR